MTIYSVSEFVNGINELLTKIPVVVQGEVSNFHIAQNRFVWFDLKDDKSVVSCFMLAFQLTQTLADGMMVQVKGNPALFSKSGRFHLRAQSIQLIGEGSLKKQYELLKNKLAAEGLFDSERKRSLPRFPKTIGLITSPDAAAYTDVRRILKNRWAGLDLKLFPVQVQGASAVGDILAALHVVTQRWVKRLDVVIITRGGGSMEDLQAFNDENVVRAIFALPIPSIVAIGHERDETLAEYVADIRASTPSNAAELAVPHKTDVLYQIDQLLKTQQHQLHTSVVEQMERIRRAIELLDNQAYYYITTANTLCANFNLYTEQWHTTIKQRQTELAHYKKLLLSYHPDNILERGYSITTTSTGQVITTKKQTRPGATIITKLRDGKFTSQVL